MWRIIICAVLLLASGSLTKPLDEGVTLPEKEKEKDPPLTTVVQESPTPPPQAPSAATEPPLLITEVTKPPQEIELPSTALPLDTEEENDVNPNRRVITYDQRQEGQYNIRADLENFMIVFIPPSTTDGIDLLDLLSKSTKRTKSSHKKYHAEAPGSKYRQSIKPGPSSHNFNFLGRHHQFHHSNPHIIVEEQPSARISDFIEGRTPYRVDISSSSTDADQLQQQFQPQQLPQVDVLPPAFPLSQHHLIKPFHLEVEPTVIQTLPPQSLHATSGKFIDANGNIFRMARAIQGGSLFGFLSLDSNRVQPRGQRIALDEQFTSNNNNNADDDDDDDDEIGQVRSIDLPLTSDSLEEAVHNYVYPPLNPAHFNPGFLDLHSNARAMPPNYPKYNEEDNNANKQPTEIELKLLGATEECGPDRKRDSYGICRFAKGY